MKTKDEKIAKQWVTIADASRFVGVSQDTLRRWEKKGTLIPRRTVGGHRRYSRKQLERILRQPMAPAIGKKVSEAKVEDQTASPVPPISRAPAVEPSPQPELTISENIHKPKILFKAFKSSVFTAAVVALTLGLLVASFLLLQISKAREQKPLSPVPTYRSLQLP